MAKQRASIRGRGAEILLGEPEEVDIQPRAPAEPDAGPSSPQESEFWPKMTPAVIEAVEPPLEEPEAAEPAAQEAASPEPDLEADLEAALFEEASGSAPLPEGEEPLPSLLDEEPVVTPEMEHAFIEEAYAAEPPPEPVAETPAPTMEVSMEEQKQGEQDALFEAPPPEVEDVNTGVLPPRPSPTFMDLHFEPAAVSKDIQEPEETVPQLELEPHEVTDEERKFILEWYTKKAKELDAAIGEAYDQIRRKAAENESVTNRAYNNLLKARDILLRRDAAKIPQAEYYIEQTQALLARVTVSESAAKKYQAWILIWGVAWSIFFVTILILLGQQWFVDFIAPSVKDGGSGIIDMEVFIAAMVWGGIGGAIAVLYSLFKHVGGRNFDPEYRISYVGKPFLAMIVGATAYMVLNIMIRVLGIFPAGLQGADGTAPSPAVAPGVIYLVAWAAGFKENRILDLVDGLMKQIFREEEKPADEPPPTTPAT